LNFIAKYRTPFLVTDQKRPTGAETD
jgi:hypothetical protein